MFESLVALVALSLMEIVLGIDNIVFITILTGKLPLDRQSLGRRLGLFIAMLSRLLLLGAVFWIVQLKTPIFQFSDWIPAIDHLQVYFIEDSGHSAGHLPIQIDQADSKKPDERATLDQEAWDEFNGVSWRDLILLGGGLFLIYSSVREIHVEVEGAHQGGLAVPKQVSFGGTIVRIAIMDIVFSLDSVITAVGMADQLWIMFLAVIIAVGVMILFANQVGRFVDRNPTVKMLALNFLLLIGVMLVAEGIGTPISKGYIYFAMGFSLLVEGFNIRIRARSNTAPASELSH
ncbi:MAG: TerC family protein [Pirellulaceae bacterium]